jgi:colanic acid biosynthesis glycosyl transferase WcaI
MSALLNLCQDIIIIFAKKIILRASLFVLYSGNIALTQPLETLIDAAVHLVNIPEIKVVIVGKKGPLIA